MFVGGRHWKVLVLLMIQTGMIGMVVLGGDREKDVKSTVSVCPRSVLEVCLWKWPLTTKPTC